LLLKIVIIKISFSKENVGRIGCRQRKRLGVVGELAFRLPITKAQ